MKSQSSVRVRSCARCDAPVQPSLQRCGGCGGLVDGTGEGAAKKPSGTYERVSETIRALKVKRASTGTGMDLRHVEELNQALEDSNAQIVLEELERRRAPTPKTYAGMKAYGGTKPWKVILMLVGAVVALWGVAVLTSSTKPTEAQQGCQSVCVERAVTAGKVADQNFMSLCRASCMRSQQQ